MSMSARISRSIYPEECFHKAAEAFQSFGSITLAGRREQDYEVKIEAFSEVEEKVFFHEFLNYLLNLSLETHLEPVQ